MSKKYARPSFLPSEVTQEQYERWLRRKAQAHVRRDGRRNNTTPSGEAYREAIHSAVLKSAGLDAYTGESLDWKLIGQYDNAESKEGRSSYKNSLALLPTVDHVGGGEGFPNFEICGWRTNDTKNDLDLSDFLSVCEAVLRHNGYLVRKPG